MFYLLSAISPVAAEQTTTVTGIATANPVGNPETGSHETAAIGALASEATLNDEQLQNVYGRFTVSLPASDTGTETGVILWDEFKPGNRYKSHDWASGSGNNQYNRVHYSR